MSTPVIPTLSEAKRKNLSAPKLAAQRSFGHGKSSGLRMTNSFASDQLSSNQEK